MHPACAASDQSRRILMRLNPHLSFNGQCEAAFQYYEKCLGGKITLMMPYGNSPVATEWPSELPRDQILHATIALGESVLTGGDVTAGELIRKPQGASQFCSTWMTQAGKPIASSAALSEGGTVQMPLQETFWAARIRHGG